MHRMCLKVLDVTWTAGGAKLLVFDSRNVASAILGHINVHIKAKRDMEGSK